MPIFEPLPDLDNCCFSIPLKIGCIIIAIYMLLFGGMMGAISLADQEAGLADHSCYKHAHNTDCPQNIMMSIPVKALITLVAIALIVASLVFLVGIYIENRGIVTMFMYVFCIAKLIDLIVSIIMLLIGLIGKCKLEAADVGGCVIASVIGLLFAFYILLVVKSFRSTI